MIERRWNKYEVSLASPIIIIIIIIIITSFLGPTQGQNDITAASAVLQRSSVCPADTQTDYGTGIERSAGDAG